MAESRGAAALAAVGSRPVTSSRNGTPAPATPAAGGTPRILAAKSSGNSAEISALAQALILKLRAKFGDAAADVKSQEIISQEVLAFVKRGVRVKEEDLSSLQSRIHQRLTGGTPVTNTLVMDKKAQVAGDEWSQIFQFHIAEGHEKERKEWLAMKERQRRTREELAAQMKEREDAKRAEQQEEMEYARQEQAALQAWEATEAAKRQLQHEIANKLKQEREEQLSDKNARRQNALARVRAEEEEMAARIAYETKMEFEKEESTRREAKLALNKFLAQNEEFKIIKETQKLANWEEDAHFQKAWQEVLDKQDRERRERLERNMIRQAKTAAYANSGALPEYKKWIDPAITEKHFKAREALLEKQEREKLERIKSTAATVAATLKEQMKERDTAKLTVRRHDEALAQVVLERAKAEEAREAAKKVAREAAKLAFKSDLERQMKENVNKRRSQPISTVERDINKELLTKVQEWKLTTSLANSTRA